MAKLSVVVCVYNTSKDMLSACLSSVCNSTFKDIEIVLVDDGSTIDYSDILENVTLPIVYKKTENCGTLKARLTGISLATSPLVSFVDSDDTVSFNFFEGLVKKQEQTKADIVINDWAFHTSKAKYFCTNDSTINSNFCVVGANVLPLFFAQRGYEHSYYVLWNKLFTRGTLAKVSKKVSGLNLSKMCFAEDVLITYFAYCSAKKIANTHVGYYFYRIHDNQEIHKLSPEHLLEQAKSMCMVFDIIETDLKINKKISLVQKDLDIWKQLMFASQSATACRHKYTDVCNELLKLYNKKKLVRTPRDISRAYDGQKILPANQVEIDKELALLYLTKQNKKVFVKRHSYSAHQLETLNKNLGKNNIRPVYRKREADVLLPKEILPFRQRLIHNYFTFKIGLLLFPKGSKIRRYLKSKL